MAFPILPVALIGGGAVVVLALAGKRRDPGDEAPPPDKNEPDQVPQGGSMARVAKPIAVGPRTDADIKAWLKSLGEVMKQGGVNTNWFSPIEVTVMPKTPGGQIAIPPQQYWPNMVETIVKVAQPLRQELGVPFGLGGYRPPDYNKAVGGAPGSRHQWFEALDIRAKGHTEELKLAAARWFVSHPGEPIGLGIYRGNIHVDYGYSRRTWEQAKKYIDKVK